MTTPPSKTAATWRFMVYLFLDAVAETCASFNLCAQSSQQTSTVLPPILTLMEFRIQLAVASRTSLSTMTLLSVPEVRVEISRPRGREGPLSESLAICFEQSLAMQRRLPEFRRRAAVSLAEGGAEMAVAGEAEVKAESGQVIILREKIQRPRQS